MIDHCMYIINEPFIHPSDKWMVCSYNHVHIFIIFIYKLPHKFPNNLKALEIRKYHRNLELIGLLLSAQYPSRNKNFVSTSKNLLKMDSELFPCAISHENVCFRNSFSLLTHPQNLLNLKFLTIFVNLRPFTQF